MKLNLDAIKNKIAALNGENKTRETSDVQLWKPAPGDYVIRGMHWPASMNLTREGEPFVERHFYYNIGRRAIVAPAQFGKEDPIADLRMTLFKSGTPEDKLIAKKLFSKMRCYMPLVVLSGAGADPEKPVVWAFGTTIYEKLLSYFLKDDIGDWLDPKEGFNLEVKVTKKPGKTYPDTTIDLARRPSALASSDEKIKSILSAVPNISPLFSEKTTEQIRTELNAWLNGDSDSSQEPANQSEGVERSAEEKKTQLDKLLDDVKDDVKATSKKTASKKQTKVEEPSEPAEEFVDDLDSAFEELMED